MSAPPLQVSLRAGAQLVKLLLGAPRRPATPLLLGLLGPLARVTRDPSPAERQKEVQGHRDKDFSQPFDAPADARVQSEAVAVTGKGLSLVLE